MADDRKENSNMIEQIKDKAKKDGFSDKEVDALLNQAKILTSKVIRDYLLVIIKEELENENNTKYKQLYKKIMQLDVSDFLGCQKIQIKNIEDITLVIQIGIANKETHKFDMLYPNMDVLKAIFFRIARFMEMTNAQYKNMMSTSSDLYKMLCEYIPNVDFSQLRINNNTWTMAFHEKHIMRIVPIVYYTDNTGHPIKLDNIDKRKPKSQISFD